MRDTESEIMKALSIRQPWAYLIAAGYKDFENRTWHTKYEGRIYIHAGKKNASEIDRKSALQTWASHVVNTDIDITESDVEKFTASIHNLQQHGALIGEVDIASCVHDSDSPWFTGPHGFVLRNPEIYQVPIPMAGRLGFFDVGRLP